ncbi:Dehydrogenase/reductase SDR family member 11 [Penicillium subrubescens]|uniref:Dehydrogenase/reductase SDR family member 11 n=2 Tax=Penicillium subrubescens TaxID=1316194 RepID=A0A1Q5UBQ8_9EURO|nr:Dehydrogenase/reductase SDR family member 11 [Penicillium subrubescens]
MAASFTTHKTVYPSISASAPELSQSGRTVLITGGSKGIGFAIARAFAQAGALRVIVVARNSGELLAVEKRIREAVSFQGQVLPITCNLDDIGAVQSMWDGLHAQQINVDVLVLNAATSGTEGRMLQESEQRWKQTWGLFEMNVRANLVCADRLINQSIEGKPPSPRAILNVSSCFLHDSSDTVGHGAYASTKTALACLLQHLAAEIPREEVQILSFHPGFVYTEGLHEICGPDDYDWDSDKLPGNFAVWAASAQAKFLHGRFVWASWDVKEVADSMTDILDRDRDYWKLGVKGL